MKDFFQNFAESLIRFWGIAREVWDNSLFGIGIGRYVVALLVLAAFLVLRRLFTRFVLAWIHRLTEKSETEFDDSLFTALEHPIRFVPVLLGLFFVVEYLSLTGMPANIVARILRSLVAFVIFWALYNVVEPLSFLVKKLEEIFTPSLVDWLIKAVKGGVVFIGAATILETWGIQVGPIIAGLGLLGVAVALGAQDLFKNLISGILILAERRFRRGDWIRVDGIVEGTVESIGFRSTLVRRFDKAPVYVPNARLSDSPVTNFSKMTHRRIFWTIGLTYATTVDQLRRIREGIDAYVTGNPEFAKPPEAELFVRIDGFGDSSVDVMLYCFTRTKSWGRWLEVKEELAYRIKEIVESAGSAFALPSRSVYLETPPGEAPEPFIPPGSESEPAGEKPSAEERRGSDRESSPESSRLLTQ